jgi:Transporter associated domain
LGFIPRGGESFEADGFRFTVMEMDHRRVSRVKMKPLRAAGAVAPGAEDAARVEQGAAKMRAEEPAGAKGAAADAAKLRSAKAPR